MRWCKTRDGNCFIFKMILYMRAILLLAGGMLVLSACTKLGTSAPTLKVSLDRSKLVADTFTYNLGDTAKFLFSGMAGNVTFYPGDSTHNYDLRNRSNALGLTQLSFSSAEQYGTQTNTLQVLVTDKLPGLDSVSVVSAAWNDVTSRAVLATTTTATASGTVDLSDQVQGANDSLFVAFKYTGQGGSIQRTWTITNFVVNNVLWDTKYPLSNLSSDVNYWTKYKIGASTAAWA